MRRFKKIFIFALVAVFLLPSIFLYVRNSPKKNPVNPPQVKAAVSGQIIIDDNPLYLVYNRDLDGDGENDPFFGAGPGDPEDFLYRSDWNAILNATSNAGANTMYAIAVNNYNSAGDCKIANCNPFYPGTNTVDPVKLDQIYIRVKALSDAGIVTWLFLYDDGLCVFGNCGSATVPQAEADFINALVNKFETIPNLIWVVAEEYQEAFGSGSQRVRNIAAAIKQADDNNHIVGVHHATGDNSFDFMNDPNIDQFSHQASPNSISGLHSAVLSAVNNVKSSNRHHVAMVEAHPYHENLLKQDDRTNLRRSGWANALSGVHVLYLCAWRYDRSCPSPSSEMLSDWGRIATFMESTNFNDMSSQDSLAAGNTQYVLANPGDSYIAYTDSYSGNMGVSGLTNGTYLLKWLDTVSGASCTQEVSVSSSSTTWAKPSGYGNELALYVKKGTGANTCGGEVTPTPSATSTPTPGGPTNTPRPSPTPGGEVITNLQVNDGNTWNVMDNLQQGVSVQYSDRSFIFSQVPSEVAGASWIQTANASKNSSGVLATFDVAQDSTVYIAHDDRITSKPAWMDDWTPNTDVDLVNNEGNPVTFSLYSKDSQDFPERHVSLMENGSSSDGMYTVVVKGGGTFPPVEYNGNSYINWHNNYGLNVQGPENGNFNGDNIVDFNDYIVWINNYLQ